MNETYCKVLPWSYINIDQLNNTRIDMKRLFDLFQINNKKLHKLFLNWPKYLNGEGSIKNIIKATIVI